MNAPHPVRPSLDELYSGKPVLRFRYPVIGKTGAWSMGAVAWFDDYYAAVDYVNANGGHIGEPEYRRCAECREVKALSDDGVCADCALLTSVCGDPFDRKDAA